MAWRKSVRRIWKLPYSTHCHLLPLLCHCLRVFDDICCTVTWFYLQMCFTWLWCDQICLCPIRECVNYVRALKHYKLRVNIHLFIEKDALVTHSQSPNISHYVLAVMLTRPQPPRPRPHTWRPITQPRFHSIYTGQLMYSEVIFSLRSSLEISQCSISIIIRQLNN